MSWLQTLGLFNVIVGFVLLGVLWTDWQLVNPLPALIGCMLVVGCMATGIWAWWPHG